MAFTLVVDRSKLEVSTPGLESPSPAGISQIDARVTAVASPTKKPGEMAPAKPIDVSRITHNKPLSGCDLSLIHPDDILEKLRLQHREKFDQITPVLDVIKGQIREAEKGQFDPNSFGIVKAYLSSLFIDSTFRKGSPEYIGEAYRQFIWHYDKGSIQSYLTICMDQLPQDFINIIAENAAIKYQSEYSGDQRDNDVYPPICSRATHSSLNMYLYAASSNDATVLHHCLADANLDRFHVFVHDRKFCTPLLMASRKTLEQVMKMGEVSVLSEDDLKLAAESIKKRECQYKELGKLPEIYYNPFRHDPEMKKLFQTCFLNERVGRYREHRYPAFEHSLVRTDPYYHANRLPLPGGQELIMSEAPIESTVTNYWQMIFNTRTNHILMLNSFDPKQCFPYINGQFGNFNVRQIGSETVELSVAGCALERRTIQVHQAPNWFSGFFGAKGETRTITHWRVKEWPDEGVVPPKFLAGVINQFAQIIIDGGKLAVHCRVGVSRTGVVAALLYAILEHRKGMPAHPFKASSEARMHRSGAVPASREYFLVCDTFEEATGKKLTYDDKALKGKEPPKEEKKS